MNLYTLPFYRGELEPKAEEIAQKIQESQGIIAMTSVHIAGMHSSMQNLFDILSKLDQVFKAM